MLGATAGDVIGSVFEAQPVKTTGFPLFNHRFTFTDDTVLTVTKRSDARRTSFLQQAIDKLTPGDELLLQVDRYGLTSRFSIQHIATADASIVIRAKNGEVALIEYLSTEQNVINVEFSSHIVLRGLEVTGGSHGIQLRDSSFITVEDSYIYHTGDAALSANVGSSTYEGLTVGSIKNIHPRLFYPLKGFDFSLILKVVTNALCTAPAAPGWIS